MREASKTLRLRHVAARSARLLERAQQRLSIDLRAEVRFDTILWDGKKFIAFYYAEADRLEQVISDDTTE